MLQFPFSVLQSCALESWPSAKLSISINETNCCMVRKTLTGVFCSSASLEIALSMMTNSHTSGPYFSDSPHWHKMYDSSIHCDFRTMNYESSLKRLYNSERRLRAYIFLGYSLEFERILTVIGGVSRTFCWVRLIVFACSYSYLVHCSQFSDSFPFCLNQKNEVVTFPPISISPPNYLVLPKIRRCWTIDDFLDPSQYIKLIFSTWGWYCNIMKRVSQQSMQLVWLRNIGMTSKVY